MYLTHKQMPAAIRKAKKIVIYNSLGANTAVSVIAQKKDLLETFKEIAKNSEWPDAFSCSVSENGWLYINGTIETKYL